MSVKAMAYVWDTPYKGTKKLLFLAIADRCDDEGTCYPGVDKLAKKCGISVRQTQTLMAELEADGELVTIFCDGVSTKHGKTNRYFMKKYRAENKLTTPEPEQKRVFVKKKFPEVQKAYQQGVKSTAPDDGVNTTSPQAMKSTAPLEVKSTAPNTSGNTTGNTTEKNDFANHDAPYIIGGKDVNAKRQAQQDKPVVDNNSDSVKKERPRNALYDAFAVHLFGIALEDKPAMKAIGGRIAKLLSFAKDRVNPADLPRFVHWYKTKFPNAEIPKGSSTFVTHWVEFEKVMEKSAPASAAKDEQQRRVDAQTAYNRANRALVFGEQS